MTDDHVGEGREDPLLVRPYLLHETAADGDATGDHDEPGEQEPAAREPSAQTWPAAATAEVRSPAASDGADNPTAILISEPGKRRRHARPGRRRLFVLVSAAAVVLLGAAAAGYAALAGDVQPLAPAALPGQPLPAVTGPQPSSALVPASATPASRTPRYEDARPTPSVPVTTPASVRPSGFASPRPTTVPTSAGTPTATQAPGNAIAPAPPADRTGVVRGQNGLCLDLDGGVPVDGNHVQAYDCNGSVAQTWTLATDGTLRILGKCALLVGDGTVHIVGCDGRTPSRWRVSGQLVINASDNGCLTDPSGGATSGTTVTVTTCDGAARQRWSLP